MSKTQLKTCIIARHFYLDLLDPFKQEAIHDCKISYLSINECKCSKMEVTYTFLNLPIINSWPKLYVILCHNVQYILTVKKRKKSKLLGKKWITEKASCLINRSYPINKFNQPINETKHRCYWSILSLAVWLVIIHNGRPVMLWIKYVKVAFKL